MIRFIGSFFGAIFTAVTLGVLFGALTIGAIFWMYSRDLPSHDSLAQYSPPTISVSISMLFRVMSEPFSGGFCKVGLEDRRCLEPD